jgi:hypothetical protein
MVFLALIALVSGTKAFSQGPVAAGQIQGSVVTQANQGIAKATVIIQQQGGSTGTPFQANTLTGADGSFSFTGVPVGAFTICVQVPGSAYLNPCTWSSTAPTVTLTAGRGASTGRIRLDEGQLLKVKLNDANRVLQADEGRVPGAQVLIGIWTPTGLFIPMRVRTKGATSRNLEIPIPIGRPLQLSVTSGYFDLTDENNAKLDATGGVSLPVQASATAALRVYTFNVAGRKGGP